MTGTKNDNGKMLKAAITGAAVGAAAIILSDKEKREKLKDKARELRSRGEEKMKELRDKAEVEKEEAKKKIADNLQKTGRKLEEM